MDFKNFNKKYTATLRVVPSSETVPDILEQIIKVLNEEAEEIRVKESDVSDSIARALALSESKGNERASLVIGLTRAERLTPTSATSREEKPLASENDDKSKYEALDDLDIDEEEFHD